MRLIDAEAFEYELRNKLYPLLVKRYGEHEALRGLHFSFQDVISNLVARPTVGIRLTFKQKLMKAGRKMKKKKRSEWSMADWCEYYETLQRKAYMSYQETGMARYDREDLRYSKIVDAFRGYLENQSAVDTARHRRMRNAAAYAERLTKEVYTKNEVANIIKEVGSF